jgi:hypothetical protein
LGNRCVDVGTCVQLQAPFGYGPGDADNGALALLHRERTTPRLGVDDAMTPKRETPWRGIAILLGLLLCAVLFAAALVVSGIMKLGFSLL